MASNPLEPITDPGVLSQFSQWLQSFAEAHPWVQWVFSGIGNEILGLLFALVTVLAGWLGWRGIKRSRKSLSATPEQIPSSELRERYLTLKAVEWRVLPLEVLDPNAADTGSRRLTLERVYVGLNTTTPRPERLRKDPERFRDEPPLSAVEAFCEAEQGRMVLLGQPGSGKSTFARYLALTMAEALSKPGAFALRERLPGWSGEARIPVFVSLGRLASGISDATTGHASQVTDFIRGQVEGRETLCGFGGPLLEELQDPGGLVIFDGLDEVDGAQRAVIKQAVSEFTELYRRCRVLVTCRTHSYRQDPGWQLIWAAEHQLADFDNSKINAFIEAWYGAQTALNPGSAIDYPDKARALKRALDPDDPRGLRDLAGTPLLLTVMAIVHTHRELPGSRVGVYRECVDILLDRWQGAREGDTRRRPLLDTLRTLGVTARQLSQGLCEVAYRAHNSGERDRLGSGSRALVSGDTLSGVMGRRLKPEGLAVFLDYCRHANGLLLAERVVTRAADTDVEPLYVFPHLSFEEYLAARYLKEQERDCIRQAVKLAADSAWWEVVRFLGEYLCHDETGNPALAKALLAALCPAREPDNDGDWRRIWLAGALLPGWRQETPDDERDPELEERIVNHLVKLLQTSTALGGAPQDRAAAGRVLAVLGDPRPGVGLKADNLPDLLWVRIPGTAAVRESGRFPEFSGFKLGNGLKVDPEARSNEAWPEDAEALEIGDFELAAYPVTVAQFRPFVETGGYQEDRFWSEAGGKTRDKEHWKAPVLWDDPMWTLANHPVIGVSWFEAEAYCNWLTARLRTASVLTADQRIRLPTEAEWEWAARGPEGWRYPWGDQPPEGRCNFGGSGINRSSAVGAFPAGAGNWWLGDRPTDEKQLYDLAGNVLEWTGSEYSEDYSRAGEQASNNHAGGARVVRGGAWSNEPRYVRAALRLNYPPGLRFSDSGFRLART